MLFLLHQPALFPTCSDDSKKLRFMYFWVIFEGEFCEWSYGCRWNKKHLMSCPHKILTFNYALFEWGSEDLATFRQQTEAWHSDSVFYTTSKIQSLGMPESRFLRGIESKSVFLYGALSLILSEVPPCVQNPSDLPFPSENNPAGWIPFEGRDVPWKTTARKKPKPPTQTETHPPNQATKKTHNQPQGWEPKALFGKTVTCSSGFSRSLILQGEEHSQVSMDFY